MEKWRGKQSDQDLWVTAADAISWALIEHNRLNGCSPSGPLLNWSINLSASLKCTVTDSGKLLSAGVFVYSLPIRQPNLPCGKALLKKVWCLISCDYWHNHVFQRAKQCLETTCERRLRAAVKRYEAVLHRLWTTKRLDFGHSASGECNIAAKVQTYPS